jgi:uncharacterized protein (DUF433 family)
MTNVRWSIVVPEATDRALRSCLACRGTKKGDISRFVEDAASSRRMDLPVAARKPDVHGCESANLGPATAIRFPRARNIMKIDRITLDPTVMGGKPCIRGLRVTVGTLLGLMATGVSRDRILAAYPYLDLEDLDAALAYAAWRLEEREEELTVA